MKVCPWCEGKGVVGRMAHAEEPKAVTVLGGIRIPVIGTMLDVKCCACEGRGQVPDDFDLSERMKAIRAERRKEAAPPAGGKK